MNKFLQKAYTYEGYQHFQKKKPSCAQTLILFGGFRSQPSPVDSYTTLVH